jgi:hypothetical protein
LARISELPGILDNITQIEQEANEDPLSSTFEALRLMNNTISKFTSAVSSTTSWSINDSGSHHLPLEMISIEYILLNTVVCLFLSDSNFSNNSFINFVSRK